MDEIEPSLPRGKVARSKTPTAFVRMLPSKATPTKRILGLDLGTNCGVAVCDVPIGDADGTYPLYVGQWDLSLGPCDTSPIRFLRLQEFLRATNPDLIFLEDVKFTPSAEVFKAGGFNVNAIVARVATASELLGALKITTLTWAELNGIPAQGVAISSIKKFATNKGNANKVDMINAANKRFGLGLDPEGYENTGVDNICDAAWVCAMGLEYYAASLTEQ